MPQWSRRDVLKAAGTTIGGVALGLATLDRLAQSARAATSATTAAKPNILYIVVDDLGWKDVGFHGSDIPTPNIDNLAKGGAKLEQFYVQPMCTPTRACLLTGRYPFRYGLQTAVIPSSHSYGLPTDEWLLPQSLKEAGYKTAIIGKWHLGHADRKYWPRQRGFDYQYGPLIGEIDYFSHEQHGVIDWFRDNEQIKEPGYSTQLLGADAVKYLEQQNAQSPFFLYLAFNAPHTPYQAPEDYLAKFAHIQDPTRRAYTAMINCVDDQIGLVLAALERQGLRDNTLIVFHSDNGGTTNPMFTGEIDMSNVKLPCDNGPYRDGKGSLYEGGTRVCALANWPGRIKPGTVDGMMHVSDMFPTLAALTGASTAKCKPLDGHNQWNTISRGDSSARTEVVYNIEAFRAGVRQGDWKLIWRTILPASVQLYNIAKDPSEKTNLAEKHPDRVARLQKRANELAAAGAKSMLLNVEFGAMQKRLKMPPVMPDDLQVLTD
jgi:arylsulfatase A-like enzyme